MSRDAAGLASALVAPAAWELPARDVLLTWLGIGSVVMFLGSLVALPWFVARIPADYFANEAPPPPPFAGRHPLAFWVLRIARSLLGAVLIALGILMLALPGQGLLTILVGLMLLEFPGKRALELGLVRRPAVLKAINWLRARAGRGPLAVAPERQTETP